MMKKPIPTGPNAKATPMEKAPFAYEKRSNLIADNVSASAVERSIQKLPADILVLANVYINGSAF